MKHVHGIPRWLLVAILAMGAGIGGALAKQPDRAATAHPLLDQEAVAALRLDANQYAALVRVQARTGLVIETVRGELAELRGRLDQELANGEPDLRRALEQGVHERRQAITDAIDKVRDLFLRFYDSLNRTQKRQVAERIEQRLRRFDRLRTVVGHLLLNQSL